MIDKSSEAGSAISNPPMTNWLEYEIQAWLNVKFFYGESERLLEGDFIFGGLLGGLLRACLGLCIK